MLLTPGNRKLGGDLIWSFSLPSGTPEVCVGMTDLCRRHCYAARFETYRRAARAKFVRNLAATRRPDFARRIRGLIVACEIKVVRIHTGGDFHSPAYARQWLRVCRGLPRTRFYFYSRSWRDAAIRVALEEMAALPNVRAWYSCDRETGLPNDLPPGVRIAWLQTDADDIPPTSAGIVFRVRALRPRPQAEINGARVCPSEDGIPRDAALACDRCGHCWKPLPATEPSRVPSLPLLAPAGAAAPFLERRP